MRDDIDTLKEAIRNQFGASADAYVTSAVHKQASDLERARALIELRGDERLLDIATGGGHTALFFAPYVREVVATDLTPAMLAAAERYITEQGVANVRFEQADAEALPFGDEEFEIVTCRVAPHHFGDVRKFVREVARVLRPGGQFLLIDTIAPEDPALDRFINDIELLRDPTHARDYTESEWRAFCVDAGLHVLHTDVTPKAIPFDDWCTRARVAPETRDELVRRLLAASPEATAHFMIEASDGQIQRFALYNLLLVAARPQHGSSA
jgi:SAM-dependent methyltransferase